MSVRRLLNEFVSVRRPTMTSDGSQGGWVQTLTALGILRVRVRPASVAERTVAGSLENLRLFVGYTEPGASVAKGDLWDRPDGTTLKVMAVRDPSAGHHREIDLEEQAGAEVP